MSRQRAWALAAQKTVSEVAKKPGAAKFRTHAFRLPTLIKQAGLAQALKFMETRDEEGKRLVDGLATALSKNGGASLIADVLRAPMAAYMALSRDALAASVWFRRFAQSELKEEANP